MTAHFGSRLRERRRQKGLTIQQMSNQLKIPPQIIESFEIEDFESMPARGYAMGMLSSYARALDLSPREVVDGYLEDLEEYESIAPEGAGSSRLQGGSGEASPRSSVDSGRYYMVDSVPTGRNGQRLQQAGYVPESSSGHEPVPASSLRNASLASNSNQSQNHNRSGSARNGGNRQGSQRNVGGSGYGTTRSSNYGSSDPSSTARIPVQDGRQESTRQGTVQRSASGRTRVNRSAERAAERERQRQLQDQGQGGRQGRSGSGSGGGRGGSSGGRGTGGGTRSSGGSRGGNGRGGSGSGQRQTQARQGSSGINLRFILILIVAAIAIIALVSLILTRGCTSADVEDTGSTDTTVLTVESSGSTVAADEEAVESETEDASTEDASTEEETDSVEEAVYEDTVVTVSVADDAVAYLEVSLDGSSVLGGDQVGPVELEYTVEESIEITTDSPSDVTVMVNGEEVEYDMKTSGVAKVTITVEGSSDSSDDSEETDEDSTETAE